ncbi:MAG: MarR family transcriptional regulator [Candidatus Gastranaerophilaceae bacterium]
MREKEVNKYYASYTESLEFAAETFSKLCKLVMRNIHKEMNFPISHEEYIILEIIHLNPGIIQLDIAKKLYIQRSYVGKLILKLEKMGLIRREQSIKGKGKIIMRTHITKDGFAIYKKIRKRIVTELSKHSDIELAEAQKMTKDLFDVVSSLSVAYNVKL